MELIATIELGKGMLEGSMKDRAREKIRANQEIANLKRQLAGRTAEIERGKEACEEHKTRRREAEGELAEIRGESLIPACKGAEPTWSSYQIY